MVIQILFWIQDFYGLGIGVILFLFSEVTKKTRDLQVNIHMKQHDEATEVWEGSWSLGGLFTKTSEITKI